MENRFLALCYIVILALTLFSCVSNRVTNMETPFVTVVKLMSAESSLAFDKAEEYMDVEQVYSKLGSENPEADWKEGYKILHNLSLCDEKVTNVFKYYNYDIEENITGNNAIVFLKDKRDNSSIKYILEKRQNKWIVIAIERKANP